MSFNDDAFRKREFVADDDADAGDVGDAVVDPNEVSAVVVPRLCLE